MEPGPMDTTGVLEWELSLPSDEIISHGWYHGDISRTEAENFLQRDREFLVRVSHSQPGEFVLSCRSNGQNLHFVIQSIYVHQATVYERCQYQFEDEAYATVGDLITSYVGSGKPISAASGARIQYPANRLISITNRIQTDNNIRNHKVLQAPTSSSACFANPYSLYNAFMPVCAKPGMNVRTPFTKERSHSLTPMGKCQNLHHGKSASADGVIQSQTNKHIKNFSSESMSNWDVNLPTSPPAKPARYEEQKVDDRRLELNRPYHVSGSDSGNGSGDSAQSSAHSDPKKARIDSDYSLVTPPIKQRFDYEQTEAMLLRAENLNFVVESTIKGFFQSTIVPRTNKSLYKDNINIFAHLIHTSGPRILAKHFTKVDLCFLMEENIQIEGLDRTASVLELLFLPQGKPLRMDVIERVETFRILIAATILYAFSENEAAQVIDDWILLAVETKTALGNLYGFSCIMFGLCMPQVECLENVWNILRRNYTESAIMFDTKLRPCFMSMNEGTNPVPPNTTTPYVLPAVLCFHLFDGEGGLMQPDEQFPSSLMNTLQFDFHATAAHLDAARNFPNQLEMFKRNAKTVVMDMTTIGTPGFDSTLMDLFQVDFHITLLYGDKSSVTHSNQGLSALTDTLNTLMAYRLKSETTEEAYQSSINVSF